MNTNQHAKQSRRIASIENDLNVRQSSARIFIGVPNADRAYLLAQRAGCTSVLWVPVDGGEIDHIGVQESNEPKFAVAYQAAHVEKAESWRPLAGCSTDQLRQFLAGVEA